VAVPLGLLYLVLLATQFGAAIRAGNLDADAVSAPVIGELFGQAGPHASVVLGTFGWYATLLFELATKWLPAHRSVWEVMPYAMALGSVALVTWSVWRLAGRWAAAISAVLLICTSPVTLHLLLPMLGAAAVVGAIVGINAASDPLVTIAGLVPFGLALIVSHTLAWRKDSPRSIKLAATMLVSMAITWLATDALMTSWNVSPEAGLHLFKLARAGEVSKNLGLWLQAIPRLANGDFFGRELSISALTAVAAAVFSLAAVAMLPRIGWEALRHGVASWQLKRLNPSVEVSSPDEAPGRSVLASRRLAFSVFWCASAFALSGVFLVSAYPVDANSDRYLVGLLYAVAALIPLYCDGSRGREAALLLGTCVFAISGISSLLQRLPARQRFPTTAAAEAIAAVATAHDLRYGYGEYWDSSPITWATGTRIQVYPVASCDDNQRLCPFDLHVISSWYRNRPGIRSFLLIDPAYRSLRAPAPDLGRPSAVYHVGNVAMYVYPYDIARRFDLSYAQWRRGGA
jgi:hypothetical protein